MAGGGWRRPKGVVGGMVACGMAAGLLFLAVGAPAGAGTSSSVALAKKHLLVLSDLPRGWKVKKGTGGSGGSGGSGGRATGSSNPRLADLHRRPGICHQ